jgi:uroporphyrinogen-III synthase
MSNPPPILLMTRPRDASERFVAELEAAGVPLRAVISPLMAYDIAGDMPALDEFEGLIFTSAQGVAAYAALGGRRDLPAYAVGRATARAAEAQGLRTVSADGAAEELVAMLLEKNLPGPLLHVHGTHTRGQIAERLSAGGLDTRAVAVYDQVAQAPTPEALAIMKGNDPIVAPVFSPRTGALLAELPINPPLLVAAMSEAVAKAVASLHIKSLRVAERPDSAAMRDATLDLLRDVGADGE